MAILLLAAHDTRQLAVETAKVLTAAQAISAEIDILVAGEKVDKVGYAAAKMAGVRKVLVAEADWLKYQLAEPLATLMLSLSESYNVFMAPANSTGKDVMPRLAGLLGIVQFSEITEILSPNTFRRPTYAGNAIETVQCLDVKSVITVRSASFPNAAEGDSDAAIEQITVPQDPGLSRFVSQKKPNNAHLNLDLAEVIVSGGRGFGSAEHFKTLLEPLALRLGAAIGASRAAVDSGYTTNDRQIGQTGKAVSPELYMAIGISGAIQHLAGMMDSRVIVAINKDPEAPIFQIADYGLVGDLFEIVPELTRAL
ncbi:MAG: electron transfer flavoprotein alpha subunit [Candidatus Tokpelaia sp. JSC085]|nr:MAG: electron transfer flavoprotein alpha subunit [Candidatus Tokpelaia sp. JSC085]